MRTKFENTEVFNIRGAMRGMRNPKNSWQKNDTRRELIETDDTIYVKAVIGPNDLDLALRLIKGGTEHRKFLRMIHVCVDVTFPRSIWQEADTYMVAVAKNSCSTMHKIQDHLLTKEDFEDGVDQRIINVVNDYVQTYRNTKLPKDLALLKAQLPEGFLQKRTWDLNYETIMTIFRQRMHHRMPHWRVDFCKWALSLPYMKQFLLAAEIITEDYEPKE